MSVQAIVFDRFTSLYGLPKTENPNGFYGEYVRALDSTDKRLLAAAIDIIAKRHSYPTWPTIGEINSAVNEAANNVDRHQRFTRPALPAPRHREPTKAERARTADLMATFRRSMQEAALAAEGERPELPRVDAGAWDAMPRRARSHYGKTEQAA